MIVPTILSLFLVMITTDVPASGEAGGFTSGAVALCDTVRGRVAFRFCPASAETRSRATIKSVSSLFMLATMTRFAFVVSRSRRNTAKDHNQCAQRKTLNAKRQARNVFRVDTFAR